MSAQVPDPNETISVSDAQMLKELAKIGKGLGGTIGKAAKEDEKKQTGLKGLMSGGLGNLFVVGWHLCELFGFSFLSLYVYYPNNHVTHYHNQDYHNSFLDK